MPEEQIHTIPNAKLYIIMLIMLISGSCNTVVMKAQDKVEVGDIPGYLPVDGKANVFKHAYFQSANTFVGEFSCLIVWMIKLLYAKKYPKEELSSFS